MSTPQLWQRFQRYQCRVPSLGFLFDGAAACDDATRRHELQGTAGVGIWEWASNDRDSEPDVVMACCGDVPTLETLAAVELLRGHLPQLRIRVVNVVNLMRLQPPGEHPHGLSDRDFDALFTKDKPIIFAFRLEVGPERAGGSARHLHRRGQCVAGRYSRRSAASR